MVSNRSIFLYVSATSIEKKRVWRFTTNVMPAITRWGHLKSKCKYQVIAGCPNANRDPIAPLRLHQVPNRSIQSHSPCWARLAVLLTVIKMSHIRFFHMGLSVCLFPSIFLCNIRMLWHWCPCVLFCVTWYGQTASSELIPYIKGVKYVAWAPSYLSSVSDSSVCMVSLFKRIQPVTTWP